MKKLLFFFGLLCMINLTFAQEAMTIHQNGHEFPVSTESARGHIRWGEANPVVPQDSIRFWTGTGTNRAVVAITWNDAVAGNIGVAWGVQWNGTGVSIRMIMDTIAAYDSRLIVSGNAAVANLTYVDSDLGLNLVGPAYYWWYNWKAADGSLYSSESAAADMLVNGDFVDWLPMDPDDFTTSIADFMIYASDPNGSTPTDPVDASLPFSDILYWVGSGPDSAEFIVNFAQPDTAFAWGYLFNGSTTAQDMVDAIAAADPRFWTDGTPSYGGDIHFVLDNGDTLGLSPVDPNVGYNFWWTNLNGVSAGAGAATTLHNGDVFKYGDMNSAIGWNFQYGYYLEEAWVKTPTPVPAPIEPTTLCTTVHPLTYSENFASYTSDQSMRPYFASAPIPECWTVYGNGTVHHVGNGSSTTADYFGGVGYSTSTNSFGAIAANDAFFAFIASQIYTGTNTNYINDMNTTGTRRYAVLPPFDQSLSQTILTFDHRTNMADANAHLAVGYIVNDTADFVALETYTADNKVLHHDTIHFNQYTNMPVDARITLMWDVASTTASTTGPGYRYCGIDNLTVALDVTDTTSTGPVDATISADQITYWVGTGSTEVIFVGSWCSPEVALAWGVRFNGNSTTVEAVMDTIAAYDSRFGYSGGGGIIYDVTYQDNTYNLSLLQPSTGYVMYNVNGAMANFGYTDMYVSQGDLIKVGNTDCATMTGDPNDWTTWGYAWETTITPVTPLAPPAPIEATIAFSDILYWVGTGSNEAVMAVNWADTALAWGYRWNGTATVTDMMTDIAAADPRFSYELGGWGLDDILFTVADGDTLRKVPFSYWESKNNGVMDAGMGQTLANGDFEKWAEPAAGVIVDSMEYGGYWYYTYVYPMTINPVSVPDTTPVNPTPEEATIAFSDILFWVGEGSNEAVMAVNWADTALAWGYRWNGTATVAEMMDHIAAADPRFSYDGTGFVNDINYIDTAAGMTTPLSITSGNWWGSTNNGFMDMGMSQTLNNGDFEKWADSGTGILVDSVWVDEWGGYWNYIYVYPMTIYPATVPDTTGSGPGPDPEHGPFCGGVGTEGCNAIAADNNQIVAWATNVVLTRGPQNISNPNSPLASFGNETNAIGPATPNNSMDAVSLGDGGSALVTFERPIQNGEGPDFAVFENDNNGGFLELAFVEVSSDGVHFVRFPATSLTQTETQTGSFAFTDPTFINNLAGKFQIGYGTPFDLAELADSANLNIDSIVYVRIIDVVGTIDPQYASYDAFGHIVNDPWPTDFASCGFDLTGVGVIHQKPVGIDNREMPQVFAYPNPCNGTLYIINENAENVALYDMNGRLLQMVDNGETHITLNMQSYPAGLYMLKVGNGVQKILKK